MITSSTEKLVSYPVKTTAAQNEQNVDLGISSPGAVASAANTTSPESFAFARGRRSLDRSVWYSGWLLTFLATAEETRGQFALIEATARKGNVPPRHIHSREEETFYVLEGEMTVSVGDRTFKATPGTLVCLPRDVAHSFTIESEQLRTLILLTPAGLEDFFKEFSVPAPAMTLPPADEPAYGEAQKLLEAAPRYGLEFLLP
jgi:quercetin dioxygenase-like cupin family protein